MGAKWNFGGFLKLKHVENKELIEIFELRIVEEKAIMLKTENYSIGIKFTTNSSPKKLITKTITTSKLHKAHLDTKNIL